MMNGQVIGIASYPKIFLCCTSRAAVVLLEATQPLANALPQANKEPRHNRDCAGGMKYIAVVGGSVSGLGKGITISSIGRLLLR